MRKKIESAKNVELKANKSIFQLNQIMPKIDLIIPRYFKIIIKKTLAGEVDEISGLILKGANEVYFVYFEIRRKNLHCQRVFRP